MRGQRKAVAAYVKRSAINVFHSVPAADAKSIPEGWTKSVISESPVERAAAADTLEECRRCWRTLFNMESFAEKYSLARTGSRQVALR